MDRTVCEYTLFILEMKGQLDECEKTDSLSLLITRPLFDPPSILKEMIHPRGTFR
jgi:hypothetical protein